MSPLVLRVLVPLALMSPLTCGGTVSNAPCEGAVGPFTSPLDPPAAPFDVAFGTATMNSGCFAGQCLQRLDILLTPQPTGCPSGIPGVSLSPGDVIDGAVQRDVHSLWLAVVSDNNSFGGTYEAQSDPWDASLLLGYTSPASSFKPYAFIWSAFFPKGAVVENGGYPAMGANGILTISQFVDGQHVAGSFDATFGDGSHLAGGFDVPFCTNPCGSL